MKKLFLTLGLASLFMVACNNTPKQQETETPAPAQTEACEQKHECPMEAFKAEFAKWETMTDEAKAELNKKAYEMFAQMDAKKAECEAEAKACCKEGKEECEKKMAEMTEEAKAECEKKCAEMKAQCEQMKAAWDNFANLTVDEQKDLILKRLEGCGGEKSCCKHEGEEGHKCQHEGEEGHQCQHSK
jgi:hypothetical protein